MLGFLHKRSLGLCHSLVKELLPLATDRGIVGDFHNKAMYTYSGEVSHHRRLYDRSIFKYVHMYNRLPQVVVDTSTVKEFQAKLTHIAKLRASRNQETWRQAYQEQGDLVAMLYGQ